MTPSETATKLREAVDLIDKGWIQGEYAQDEDGNHVSEYSPVACRFCAMGALYHVIGNFGRAMDLAIVLNREIRVAIPDFKFGVPTFNDEIAKSAADVSGMMRRAADRVEKEDAEQHSAPAA